MTPVPDNAQPLVLVTGAAGRLGSAVVRALVTDGWRVVAVDNLAAGDRARLDDVCGPACRFVQADIRDRDALTAAAAGITHVVHLAEVRQADGRAIEALTVNVGGVEAVLDVARGANATVVFGSSDAVLGKPATDGSAAGEHLIMGDADDVAWDYPVAKMIAEHLCFAYRERYGLTIGIVRFASAVRDTPWPLSASDDAAAAGFRAAVESILTTVKHATGGPCLA